MRSPFYFIAKPVNGNRYNNTKKIEGIDFIVNSSEEEHLFSNREALVVSTPLNYSGPIKPGDTLLVHHNTFKFYNDIKGNRKSGKSFFKEDLFFIEDDQFFLFKSSGTWKAHSKYCFVKPILPRESYVYKPFDEEPLMGEMMYPNDYLLSQGVRAGDIVCFAPDSEYEFKVDEVKMYRVFDHQVTIKL